ncbi:MAG: hypothetical protein GY805_37695, partial [Chloroflexi bacterium]|nr:hypothetical protein [Chloroflexota bacterium]
LVALVVLWPAWRLWEQVARQPHGKMPRVVAALALGAAAWATMATSPCNAPDIQRVLAFENRIYIQPARRNVAFVSENETRTWQYASSLPPEALAVFQQSVSFPLERCVPKNPNTCYRIEGKSKIDFSLDGKQSWRTGWRAPTWRTEYFNRLLTASCTEFPDFAPIDLTILPLENGDYLVIATLGNQGIVTYHPAVGWQQQPVLDAEPTPTAVPPSEIDSLLAVISFESIFWTLMIFIIPIRLTSSLASKPFQDKTKFASSFAFSTGLAFFVWQWIFLPFSLIALPTLIIVLFFHTVMFSGEGGVYAYLGFLLSAWLLVVYYRWLKKRISNNVGDTERTSLPPWSYISKGLVTAFLGWLPFALWAWEVIPNHWIAVGISVAASSLYYWQSIHDIAALRGE